MNSIPTNSTSVSSSNLLRKAATCGLTAMLAITMTIPTSRVAFASEPTRNVPTGSESGSTAQTLNGIPMVNISLSDSLTWDAFIAGSKDQKYKDNKVSIADPDGVSTSYNKVQIKGRGNSTWVENTRKKPFQLKFDQKTDLFGLGAAKKWVFLANALDDTLVRNDTALFLGEELGVPGTQAGRFVDLTVNGEYLGNYYVCHQVENSKTSINLKNQDGVLVEIDNISGHENTDPTVTTDDGSSLVLKESYDDDNSAQVAASMNMIRDTYNRFYQAACAGDWDALTSIADMPSFEKYYLINNYMNNIDGFVSSFYIYQDGANAKLTAGPLWDFDLSCGNLATAISEPSIRSPYRDWTWTNQRDVIQDKSLHDSEASIRANDMFSKLMDIPQFRSEVKSLYKSQMRDALAETDARLAYESTDLAKSGDADHQLYGGNGFNGSLAELRGWLQKRTSYFDELYGDSKDIADGVYEMSTASGTTDCVKIEKSSYADGYCIRPCSGANVYAESLVSNAKCKQDVKDDESDSSVWYPVSNDDGSITFVNRASGNVLSFDGSDYSSVDYNADSSTNKGKAQRFVLSSTKLDRVWGPTAADTAVDSAKRAFPDGYGTVIIARNDYYSDGLAASGLAGVYDCPILLTAPDSLEDNTVKAIKDNGVKHVIIVGGEEAVTPGVQQSLAAIDGVETVERVAGDASWDTSYEIAKRIQQETGGTSQGIILSTGDAYFDALSISSVAYKYKIPIVLCSPKYIGALTGNVASAIRDTKGSVYITGGPDAVPEDYIANVIQGKDSVRIWGQSAADTSNQIATYFTSNGFLDDSNLGVSTGLEYRVSKDGSVVPVNGTDSLVGSPLLGKMGAPLILATNGSPTIEGGDSTGTPSFVESHKDAIQHAYVMGGYDVMPNDLYRHIGSIIDCIND